MSNNIERIWFFGYLKYLCFLFSSFMILPQYLSNDSGVRLCTSSGLYCRFWAVACCYCFRWGEFEPAKHRKFESFNTQPAQKQQIPSQSSSTVVVSNIVKGSSTMGSLPAFTHSLKVSTLPEDEKSWPLHTPTWEPMFFNVNTGDSEQS